MDVRYCALTGSSYLQDQDPADQQRLAYQLKMTEFCRHMRFALEGGLPGSLLLARFALEEARETLQGAKPPFCFKLDQRETEGFARELAKDTSRSSLDWVLSKWELAIDSGQISIAGRWSWIAAGVHAAATKGRMEQPGAAHLLDGFSSCDRAKTEKMLGTSGHETAALEIAGKKPSSHRGPLYWFGHRDGLEPGGDPPS